MLPTSQYPVDDTVDKTDALPDYYKSLPTSLASKFQNLDNSSVYSRCKDALKSAATKNFIVDFGGGTEAGGQAWCAVDIDPADRQGLTQLLNKDRPLSLRTRWINIFAPYEQADLVAAITSKYGFSPRLTNVITTPPMSAAALAPAPQRPPSARRRSRIFHPRSTRPDIETGSEHVHGHGHGHGHGQQVPPTDIEMRQLAAARLAGTNYMDLAQSVWHWHAVEWGNSYICTGFNHLHIVPTEQEAAAAAAADGPDGVQAAGNDSEEDDEEEEFDTGDYNPEGRRIWSWLILCDDGTVISIQEPLAQIAPDDLVKVRRNMLGVFRSLSLSDAASNSAESLILGGGLDDLPFRVQGPRGTPREFENVQAGPSLLLYYLFDDWHSIYRFVRLRGDPYSTQMRRLRNDMHKNPNLGHLAKLNALTRQLAMLKRMYETRKIILDNVLYRQENASKNSPGGALPLELRKRSEGNLDSAGDYDAPFDATANPFLSSMGSPDVLGVTLSTLAVAKFERLRDRIRLYILGELDALLVEKSELENLTFNLISLKQSATVEVLTRVTIWLAAFTVLFLPLTLVTGYFSMQLRDLQNVYTQTTFWGSAGVSIAVTLLVLYTVGKSTRTVQVGDVIAAVRKVWFGWTERKKLRKRKKTKAGSVRENGGSEGGKMQ
ncbi:hypothetical protein EDC01DRAFT_654181 [Geopyxis carbonaria]|nr:hypothetical protein EDC01DRAFT_654181 [Geopyxis carbonaria]